MPRTEDEVQVGLRCGRTSTPLLESANKLVRIVSRLSWCPLELYNYTFNDHFKELCVPVLHVYISHDAQKNYKVQAAAYRPSNLEIPPSCTTMGTETALHFETPSSFPLCGETGIGDERPHEFINSVS